MKAIQAKDILFKYNPNIKEFTIFSGLKFINIGGRNFDIDINPHGQSEIRDVISSDLDLETQTLHCQLSVDENVVDIETKFQINMLGFKTIVNPQFIFDSENDLDKMDLFFEGDIFKHLYLSKLQDYNILDSIRIFEEQGEYFVVKNMPEFIREKLEKISINDNEIIAETQNQKLRYKLDVSESIILLLQDIFRFINI